MSWLLFKFVLLQKLLQLKYILSYMFQTPKLLSNRVKNMNLDFLSRIFRYITLYIYGLLFVKLHDSCSQHSVHISNPDE